MQKHFGLGAILSAALFDASPVLATELVDEVSGWKIYRNAEMGNGCYMQAAYEDGSVVQLGVDLAEDVAFIAIYNEGWSDIEADAVYPVTIDLDSESYTADALGVNDDGVHGIIAQVENEEFFVDLAKRHTLTLSNSGGEITSLDLEGSKAAFLATVDCLD